MDVIAETLRRERGRIVAGLLRLAGSLEVAEDALQDAVVAALSAWRVEVPRNPAAWLTTAARRVVLDARRHEQVRAAKAALLVDHGDVAVSDPDVIADDYLRLLFTCCHPALPVDGQIALTLKVVAGWSMADLARLFVTTEDTISQRLLRAKRLVAEHAIEVGELGERVGAVLGVINALCTAGESVEAMRLARLVTELVPEEPETWAMRALAGFTAARAAARVDEQGVPVLLEAQDRALWDRRAIRDGLVALQRAGAGSFAWQARIACAHVTAPTWAATDWRAILALYDELAAVDPSPIVALNRAVALAMVDGADAALAALEPLETDLREYHLFYAIRADLLERAGRSPRSDLERALALVRDAGERVLLERRLARAT